MLELTSGQTQLLEKAVKWFRNWEEGHRIGEHPQWFIYSGAAGTGKALPNDTVIPTPEGDIKLSDLGVGDEVFNIDGKPVRIMGVFPQGEKDTYEITFQDGRTCRCCNEHLWTVYTPELTMETITLEEIMKRYEDDIYSSENPCKIPMNGPVDFVKCGKKHIKLSPTIVGATFGKAQLSTFMNMPENIKYNSKEVRLDFLHGLIKSCGYKTDSEYYLKVYGKQFKDDVIYLCQSLGMYVYCTADEEPETYNIHTIQNTIAEFNTPTLAISEIKFVGRSDMTCIYVDDPMHLFLTENFIVTHNTTVVKELLRYLGLDNGGYIAAAYVGKAVLQLQKHNLKARTIHSLIYDVIPVTKKNPETGKKYLSFEFVLKEKLEKDYRLIIIDEAAMVNDEIRDQISSFGIPIIFMGDMNQLPPVFGKSTIMDHPDHVLTQIMRQAENDPIVQLSQMVLKDIPLLEGEYGDCRVLRNFELSNSILTDYDQILCTSNKTREFINNYVRREIKGFDTNEPKLYDKVICRQNNWGLTVKGYSLTNGLSGTITDISRRKLGSGYYIIDFQPDILPPGIEFTGLHIDAKYIKATTELQNEMRRTQNEKFQYAYAITVHLSQGSEYDRVLFFDQWFHDADLTKKARYTAITRAKKAIDIVQLRKGRY